MIGSLPGWALALLRESRVARLGTADRAGHPLVVPVCYVLDEATGRIHSVVDAKPKRTRDLRRLRNIADNPHASLLVDRWDEDWSALAWVMVDAHARVVTGGADLARAVDLLTAKYPQYRAMGLRAEGGTGIVLTPSRIRHWAASHSPGART